MNSGRLMSGEFVGMAIPQHHCDTPAIGALFKKSLPIGTLWQCPVCHIIQQVVDYEGLTWWFTTPDELPEHLKQYAGCHPKKS